MIRELPNGKVIINEFLKLFKFVEKINSRIKVNYNFAEKIQKFNKKNKA